ncbi:3-oxoacyl-[acyl-carrier-protein] reductase [Candidatus Woesearchaeota archaeon]|nr:3-oxoacyl-[acyl-carrier-protein] reductase [Candidatus Woesearchaeota archaeon]
MQGKNPWKPDRPTSRGAAAYHEAVSKAEYYITILDELVKIISPKIRKKDIVVDYGAGTGVSALRLLEHLKVDFDLWLVDNSAAWLGKAYEVLSGNPNVKCFLLEKTAHGYSALAETVGKGVADHVISANTFHLVPDIDETFRGIADALKENGTFAFQSGNITRASRPKGALMVDDSVRRVHELSLDIVRNDPKFAEYKKDIDARIKANESQRKFVFPDPRNISVYLEALKKSGFEYQEPSFKLFRVRYSDWLNFLRVRRLQAGILPEIGGHEPSEKEESDRDSLITMAANNLFKELQAKNPLADKEAFTIEVAYVVAKKKSSESSQLAGKVALVTGASRGIGRAIAVELARQGADVIINYNKNEKEAMEVVNEIKKHGARCIALKADVSNFDEVKSMFDSIKKEFGFIDILVNNAGIIMDKTLQNMDADVWNKVIKINLNGVYNMTKHALPLLRKKGRIISIGSIVGIYGNFGQVNYAASKAGIIGFSKSLAKELGRHGITVNVIAPGFIETEILNSLPDAKKKELSKSIPLGNLGNPEDIANLAAFLASEKSSYITGEVICVDGGLML